MNGTATAKEIAEGLHVAISTVTRRANKEGWSVACRSGRGGGKAYLLEALPEPIRIALSIRQHSALSVLIGGKRSNPQTPASVDIAAYQPPPPKPLLHPDKMHKAAVKADLVRHYQHAKLDAEKKNLPMEEARDSFINLYNSGISLPYILEVVGKRSWKTLERWSVALKLANYDCEVLADRYGRHRKGKSKVTEAEKEILLRLLLNQNRLKLPTAIRWGKEQLARMEVDSPSSPSTLRNFVNDFKAHYADIWTLAREGEKALTDKIAPYFERDISLLEVGDVLIADGHRCNFRVINPFTGKPVRPTLVAFLDWASRDILGYAFMLQEDTQGIHLALYRAILRLGKMPKVVYLDNGKGFKSKVFTDKSDLSETGMAGLYGRLGIMAVFAKPYNARSKVIEPFFKTFGDEFERFVPSFSGASITDKPARLRRNEKFMRNLAPDTPISIEQASNAFQVWLDSYYRKHPHSGLGKRSPDEVFKAGRGPGVNPANLHLLMMNEEVGRLDNNGVPRFGGHYLNDALYGLRIRVFIRYDWHDLRSVHVYDMDGNYICEAKRTEAVHPMFALIGGKDAPGYSEFRERKKAQESLKRSTKKLVAEAARQGKLDGIRDVLPIAGMEAGSRGLVADLEGIEAENTPRPCLPTFEEDFPTPPSGPGPLIDPTRLDYLSNDDLKAEITHFQSKIKGGAR